jgi:hypothetical protein
MPQGLQEMKARIRWHRRLYWWWKVRHYELDPGKVTTFWEWLNLHDMHLCKWEMFTGEDNLQHRHELVPLEMEEAEAVLERYLRNVRKIYGEQKAGGNNG